MPLFDVKIVSDSGEINEVRMEAENKLEIYDITSARNELILSVKEFKEPFDFNVWFKQQQKVKPREVEHFTTQLSIMLNAGVPLLGTLDALKEQAESEVMEEVITSLHDQLNEGISLSGAMRKFPRVFSVLYINMIEAGEKSGSLDAILKRLTDFIGHEIEVVANVKSAMRYPIIVFTALILAFTAAIVFVIPKFATLFQSQGMELPLPTRILIGINTVMTSYWYIMLFIVLVIFFGLRSFFRTPKGMYTADLIKLKVPIFKPIVLKSVIARFAHMMDTLSNGGIPIISALETAEKTVGNLVVGKDIAYAREKVAEGVSLAESLGESKYFPKMTIKMISVGEKSGALDAMLTNIAKQYDAEVDEAIKKLSAAIEPMMTVVMGAFLLLMALGIFLPMWNMYGSF